LGRAKVAVTPECCNEAIAVGVLTDALDQLLAEDPSTLADIETMQELLCQRSRFDALVSQTAARFEAEGDWAPSGAKTATVWIVKETRLAKPDVKQLVKRGRQEGDPTTQAVRPCVLLGLAGTIRGIRLRDDGPGDD